MTQVYVGIGSNIDRTRHITAALEALTSFYGDLRLSSVFESEPVGFEGDNFFNLVAGFQTNQSVADLSRELKSIEIANGRKPENIRYSPRTLDIDILLYGDMVGIMGSVQLPRAEVTENAFVLWPLAEVAGSRIHPVFGVCFQDLWEAMPKQQTLTPVSFVWRGRELSLLWTEL